MKIDISTLNQGKIEGLQRSLYDAHFKGNLPKEFSTDDIDGIKYFFEYLKKGHEVLVATLVENDFVERDEESGSFFEKSIRTIVKNDIIYKLLNPEKKYQRRQENDRLSKFLSFGSHNMSETNDNSIEIVANGYYKRFKEYYKDKFKRIRKQKKVIELGIKYPDVDIERAISYAILTKKLNLVNEDIHWLDDIINIIKSGKKKITTSN